MRERGGRELEDEFVSKLIELGRKKGVPDLEKEGYGDILPLLPKGPARMLDLGCGTGRYGEAFGRKLPHLKVVAIDREEKLVREAKKYSHIAESRKGDMCELDIGSKFDFIFARDSLHYADKAKIPDMFRKINKALKESGILAFSFFRGEWDFVMASQEMNFSWSHSHLSERQLRTLMDENGFEIISVKKRDEEAMPGFPFKKVPHFEVIARKKAPDARN